MVSKSKKEERKNIARACIQAACEDGKTPESRRDIEEILVKQAESYHIRDFFDCLWEKDLEDLLNNVKISTPKRSRPPSNKPVTSPISEPLGAGTPTDTTWTVTIAERRRGYT